MKKRLALPALAVTAMLAACGGSAQYADAFGKLVSGESNGFKDVATKNMVQVGDQEGAPQVHFASSVQLPDAKLCYVDSGGLGDYVRCILVEGASRSDADAAFASAKRQADDAAAPLHLHAVTPAGGASAGTYRLSGDGGRNVLIVEQGDGNAYTVSYVFGKDVQSRY